MATKEIKCSFLPKSKRESLYSKFKETHSKTSLMSFVNYLNYAHSFMGLDLNSADDIILNKVGEALKQIDEKKTNTHAILPRATVLSPIKSAEEELYVIRDSNGMKEILIHDVPTKMIDDVIDSIIDNFGIEDTKIINNLRNNLQSTNRMNVFLRFLAKEQLYAELTGADNDVIVGNAIKYANTLFATNSMFKNDGTTNKEIIENDFNGVVQPFNTNKSGYIGCVTGKGYTAAEAYKETNRVNMEETDATIIVRPTDGLESHVLKRLGESSKKTSAQTYSKDPIKAGEIVARGLAKKKGAKVINFKGNTLEEDGWTQSEWNEYMLALLQEAQRLGANIQEVRTDGMNGVGVATIIAASALGIKTSIVVPAFESEKGVITYPTQPVNRNKSNSHASVHFGVFNTKGSTSKTNYLNRFSRSTVENMQARLGTKQAMQSSSRSNSNGHEGRNNSSPSQGINIAANSNNPLAKKLTNPGNNLEVEYKGKKYRNAEHAYQTWKSGEFDESAYNSTAFLPRGSKPVNKETSYQTMVDILTAKLQQHPELVDEINKAGGLDFIKNSTHNTSKGDKFWESGEGNQNGFIRALTEAAQNVGIKDQGSLTPSRQNNGTSSNSSQELSPAEKLLQQAIQLAQGAAESQTSVDGEVETAETQPQKADTISDENPAIEAKSHATLEVNDNSPKGRLYRIINPQTVQHREAMMARDFKEMVNTMIDEVLEEIEDRLSRTDEEALSHRFEDQEMQLALEDEANARKYFIVRTGVDAIFNRIKEKYQRKIDKPETSEYEKEQYQIVLDNFDILMSEAKVMIESKENLIIDKSREEDEGDQRESQEGAQGNDGWVVKARTTDPHTTISGLTRQALEDIRIINPETGVGEVDDLGYPLFYNEDDLHGILIKEMASLITSDDFAVRENPDDIDSPLTYPKLEALAGKYGWIEQLIDKLNEDEQLVATFYTDFRKDFISYWKTRRGKSIELNSDSGTESQFSLLEANYSNGIRLSDSSLYTNNSTIDKSKIEELETLISTLGESLDDFEMDRMDESEVEDEIVKPLMRLYKALGFTVTQTDVQYIMQDDMNNVRDSLTKAGAILERLKIGNTSDENYVSENDPYTDVFRKELRAIAKTIGTVDAEYVIASLRQGDETRYSYSAPNYIDTMFKNLTHKNPRYRKEYIENKWGKYGWFRDQETGEWKVKWIEDLYNDAIEAIKNGEDGVLYKELKMKDIPYIVQGAGNSEELVKYNDWTGDMIIPAYIGEYFAYPTSEFANYNFPIFADSPCAKFIRMRAYKGADFKDKIIEELHKIARQELWRMAFVEQRYAEHAEPIQNFDNSTKDGKVKYGRGSQFCFFPFLNSMTFFELAKLQNPEMQDSDIEALANDYIGFLGFENVDTKTSIKDAISKNNGINSVDSVDTLLKDAIEAHMNQEFDNFMKKNIEALTQTFDLMRENGVVESLGYSNEDANDKGDEIARKLFEEYYWNQQLATAQIIEMTTTDLAFYKNATDFQKRYKEVYASGGKLFTNSKYGRKFEKTLYLKDFSIASRSWDVLRKTALEAKDRGELHDAEMLDILDKYISNNQVDAQAYRSISSYRAVLDMMGLWGERMNGVLQRFQDGTYTMADFNIVWGTIKPFLYTVSESANGTSDASYGTLMVPHQNKNSEFVILSTIQTIGGLMSQSPKMKALNRFMEDTGVDVVQFESAVKAGGQGIVDIGLSENKLAEMADILMNDKANNYVDEFLAKKKLDVLPASQVIKYYNYGLEKGYITQEQYNKVMDAMEPDEREVYEKLIKANTLNAQMDQDENLLYSEGKASFNGDVAFNENRIHTHSYDDYMIAQPTPQHFLDTDAVFGSQFRNLIISDIPDVFGVDSEGKPKATTFKVNGKTYTKQQLLDTYRKLITENLLDGYVKARNKFTDIYELQKYLKEQVQGNPKYPADMVDAFEIVQTSKGPVFNIPLSNPSTTIKIQELINSTFKTAVTKQRIKGGSAILVSSFGFSKQLEVVRNEDGSIKAIECYLPAYSKQFYEPFMGEDGTLDIKKMPKELRKIIGYRIPTENKYSMCNLVIKGFLPQQNGGAIMLPAEITTMSGADYDVDKMFLMFPEFKVYNYNKKEGLKDYKKLKGITGNTKVEINRDGESKTVTVDDILSEALGYDLEDSEDLFPSFDEWWEKNKENYAYDKPIVKKVNYNHDINDPNSIPSMSRAQRDNMLIDISYSILSHPAMAMNVNNPGSFDKIKRISRVTEIAENPAYRDSYMNKFNVSRERLAEHLMTQDLDTLDGFLKEFAVEMNPLSIDTFLYNHKQNTTGGTLIGIYANGTTGQAKFQESGLAVKDNFAFEINGRPMQRMDQQRTGSVNGVRELISKNCAEWSAASVDNVKDPVLAKLWQSKDTANITIALIRMGCTIDEVGLLFKHPAIQYLASQGTLKSRAINDLLFGENGIRSALEEEIKSGAIKMRDREKVGLNTQAILEDLCRIESPFNNTDDIINYCISNPIAGQRLIDILSIFKDKIIPIADALSEITRVTRADSPNGAMQRSLSRALNQRIAVDNMRAKVEHEDYPLANVGVLGQSDLLGTNGVSKWASKDELRQVFNNEKGLVSPFYTLGIDAPISIISQYFSNYSAPILEKVIKMARDSNNVRGTLKDDTMDDLFFEMTTFLLSKTRLFGDDGTYSFEEKRDYYLYEFPKELIDIKQSSEYEDINNLIFMKKLQVIKGELMLVNGGKLTPSTRMAISQSIDALLYMDGPNQEKAHQLAIDLMAYSYYRDGFRFGPNNYGSFFSNTFLNAFPELVDALRTYDLSGDEVDNFLEQFIANHPWQTSTIIPTDMGGKPIDKNIKFDEGTDGRNVTVKGNATINLNLPKVSHYSSRGDLEFESYAVAKRILINGNLYQYIGSEVSDKGIQYHHYEIDNILPKDGKKVDISSSKYNANMSKDEICVIPINKEKLKASSKLFSSSKKSKSNAKKSKIKAGTVFNANESSTDVPTSTKELKGLKNLIDGEESASEAKQAYADILTDETQQKHTSSQITEMKEALAMAKANAESEDDESTNLEDIKNAYADREGASGNSSTLEESGINHQDDSSISNEDDGAGFNLADIKAAYASRKPTNSRKDYSNNNKDKTKFCQE